MVADESEQVVLLDNSGQPIGAMRKDQVHSTHTPLHLAFSCYLLNDRGEVLVTRRALGKRTWPGVWTNSFCGHPAPGEGFAEAIRRRGRDELGADVTDIRVAIADLRYRAGGAGGGVENEICPVYVARLERELAPNPDEVSEWAWVLPATLADAVEGAPFAFSPWLARQLPRLVALPGGALVADVE